MSVMYDGETVVPSGLRTRSARALTLKPASAPAVFRRLAIETESLLLEGNRIFRGIEFGRGLGGG